MSDQELLDQAERVARGVALPDDRFDDLLRRRDRKRRSQRIAAGVVGIAVFVAAIWIVTSGGVFDRSETSVVPGGDVTGPAETGPTALEPVVPPPGIPPHGATPSFPETGELILSVSLFSFGVPPAPEELTHMYVYADGRLIWSRDSDLLESTDAYNTGLVEQRLTPEGAEMMRSEVISSGLIDPDSVMVDGEASTMVDGEADPDPLSFIGAITVRDADRLVRRDFAEEGWVAYNPPREHIATAEEERSLERLYARLTDTASWLPASAWADQEIRAYVPSRYKVCYGGETETVEPERVFNAVPGPAEELLRAKAKQPTRVGSRFGGGHRYTIYCSDLTTEETRVLFRALDDAGLEQRPSSPYPVETVGGSTFEYHFWLPEQANIWIDPYLPHGDAICIPCT